MQSASGAKLFAKAASASLTIGAAGAIGVAGVVIPLRLAGVLGPSEADAAPADVVPEDPRRAKVQAGLKELLESAGLLVSAHGGRQAHVIFWRADADGSGRVSADEVFILAHHPLLETLVAYSWEGERDGAPISHAELFSDGLFSRWRRREQVVGAVVAAGVRDVRFASRLREAGDGDLTVHLTWAPSPSDENAERPDGGGSASSVTARVPALRRVR